MKGKATAKVAESEKEAKKQFGAKGAKKLCSRLSDLRATPKLGCLPSAFGAHPLSGDRKGQFALTAFDGVRIVFVAREPVPKNEDGSTDWPNVDKIEIIFIGDYH